jgi:hypothetical protein
MAKTPRSIEVETTVTIDDVDFTVKGTVYPGYPARPWANHGEGDPGDPGEITDIEMVNDAGSSVDFESLPPSDRSFVEEALSVAADEEARGREEDAADRAHDAWRDEQFERGIRDDYFGGGK